MKRCKHITCWTDYPFVELGDEPGKPAPIRHVNIIDYDGNKYATVSFERCGDFLSLKIGYLYSQPGRYGQVKRVNPRKIERMGDGKTARQMDQLRKKWAAQDRRRDEFERRVCALMRKGLSFDEAWAHQAWQQ